MVPSTLQLIPIDFSYHPTIVILYLNLGIMVEQYAGLSHWEKVVGLNICIYGMLVIEGKTDGWWLMSTH